MSFKDEMSPHDGEWQETEAAGGALPLFSDGTHQAQLTMCRVYDHPDFGWQWEIGIQGTDSNTGRVASMRKWHNLPPSDAAAPFVKGDAEVLGYDGLLSGLEEACTAGQFDDLLVEIYVKSKPSKDDPAKMYANVYFNKTLGKGEPIAATEAAPAADDDDIPF